MLDADSTLTIVEACSVLGARSETLVPILAGPFAPQDGWLTLRQALGVHVAAELAMLTPGDRIDIGVTAARDARLGGSRILMIAWGAGPRPKACWREECSPHDLMPFRSPVLILPADRLLTALAAELAEHRASTARPN